jgi:hypothetical protein
MQVSGRGLRVKQVKSMRKAHLVEKVAETTVRKLSMHASI